MSKKKSFYQLQQKQQTDEDEVQIGTPNEIKFPLIENEAFLTSEQLVELENLKCLLKDKKFFHAHQRKEKLLNQYINDKVYSNCTQTFFEFIDDELLEIQELTKWFDLKDGLYTQTNHLGIHTQYFHLRKSHLFFERVETEIKGSLENFISQLYETELYPNFIGFSKESKTILQPDLATKILHIYYSSSIFSDREMLLKVWFVDNFTYDGSFLILSHSIDKRQKILDRYGVSFQTKPKNVRGNLHALCTKVEPLSFDHFKVTQVSCMDQKSFYLYQPQFHMIKTSGILQYQYEGSKWEKKKQQNSEFYNWLRDKFQEFSQQHMNSQQLQYQNLIQHKIERNIQ